jgi:hypothetical protein
MKPNISELIVLVECCMQKNLIIRNKASINNVLGRLKASQSNQPVDIASIRILTAGLLHLMIARDKNPMSQEKRMIENQLTSEGRLRRIQGKHILVSMGEAGVLWCGSKHKLMKDPDIASYQSSSTLTMIDDEIACLHLPAKAISSDDMQTHHHHSSGAGDSFCAGLISYLFEGRAGRVSGPSVAGIQQGLLAAHRHITKTQR